MKRTQSAGDERRKKFLFSAKNNAKKEIEAWGKDYGSLTDGTMRSAGQLTDNVTEARMLQNKIMDMSRDRFKYKHQAEYKKKFFISQQQKKSKIMPQLLTGIDIEMWMSTKAERYVPQRASSPTNARFAFLERFGNTGEKCKDFEELNPFDFPEKPKVIIKKPELPEFYRIRLAEQEEENKMFSTQPQLCRSAIQKSVTFNQNNARELKLPTVKAVAPASVKSLPSNTVQRSHSNVESTSIKERPERRAMSSPAKQRSVEDPRYMGLEKTLSNRIESVRDADFIKQIIREQDSLHTPSKQSTINRPKLQKQILEYLRQKGVIK